MGEIHQQSTNGQAHLLLVLRQVIICRFAKFRECQVPGSCLLSPHCCHSHERGNAASRDFVRSLKPEISGQT